MIRKRTITAVVGAVSAVALGVTVAPPATAVPVISFDCGSWGSGTAEIEPFPPGGEFAFTTTFGSPVPVPSGIPVTLETSAGSYTSQTLASWNPVLFDDFSGPAVASATVTTSHRFIIHAPPPQGDVVCNVTSGGTIVW
ncbi:MAG TPA: hypothetical protein VLH10_05005 [Yinghuangia sp.]|uniref:hypothetical protein n=1 Tax=Yinghuangia sp. YIM S10712 TaxID=3436930 RepID=UPI002CB836BC|nr:hypothetical protein [Yinghuangia sp.]